MKVYEYGIFKPSNEPMLVEQLKLANRYYNKLIEIERDRRAAVRAAQARLIPEVGEIQQVIDKLEADLEEVRGRIQQTRQRTRSGKHRRGDSAEAREIKARLAEARKQRTAAKLNAQAKQEELLAAYEEASEQAHKQCLEARAANGLYYGTYLCVEEAVYAACKSKKDPEFKRWNGGGTIGVQVQGGITPDELFGNDTRVQIDPAPWKPMSEHGTRNHLRSTVRLRVGSEGRRPIWHEWRVVLHRPLPEGAKIMWVKAIARRGENRQLRWSLQFSVNGDDPVFTDERRVVALDLGWRLRPDGTVRVAYWHDGETGGELTVPTSVEEHLSKASSIRGFRDRDLNIMRPLLDLSTASAEVRAAGETVALWKSLRRFHALHEVWKHHRAPGDEAAYRVLDEWHKRDRHLERYERGLRDRAIRSRRDLFRVFAKQLAARYGTVILEDWKLPSVSRHPLPEDGPKTTTEADRQRVRSAPGQLRELLEAKMRCVKVDPARTTLDHHETGIETCDDPARTVDLRYGVDTEDQDRNAALALLARGRAAIEEQGPLAYYNLAKAKRPPRFAKRHKPKEEVPKESLSQTNTQDTETTS